MSGFVGILMLDTGFQRIPGDVGNPQSYPFPVRLHRVQGAGVAQIVQGQRPDRACITAFVRAARDLEAAGAVALISSCGFLVQIQKDIAEAVDIPVMLSALSLTPLLQSLFPGRSLGVLTASAAALDDKCLRRAGFNPAGLRVVGLEDCRAFAAAILEDGKGPAGPLDARGIEAGCVAAAQRLLAQDPDIAAFLLECGNLPPYAAAIQAATGRPVFGILDAARLLYSGALPRHFATPSGISP